MFQASLNLDYKKAVTSDFSDENTLSQFAELCELLATRSKRKPINVALYGANHSGHMTRNALANCDLIRIVCAFDKSEVIYDSFSDLPIVDLYEHDCHKKIDAVVVTTAPRYYSDITKLISEKINPEILITLYKEQETEDLEEPDMLLSARKRICFTDDERTSVPLIKKRSALVMIDIWNNSASEPCAYCEYLPSLIDAFLEQGLPVINAPSFIDREADSLPRIKPRVRERTWPPDQFAYRQGQYSHLSAVQEFMDRGMATPNHICECSAQTRSGNYYTLHSLEDGLNTLEKHGTLNVFYVGGGMHACLMYKPLGWLNILGEGYLPIMIRDACCGGEAYYDGKLIDMATPGIIHFEYRCGYSTTSVEVLEALSR